jgi:hypothetical protein
VRQTVTLNPGQPIYLQVLPYGSKGRYRISVTPQNAYDAFEPNDSVLTPAPVKMGTDINAGVLDDKDSDWYRVSGGAKTSGDVRESVDDLAAQRQGVRRQQVLGR